MRVALLVMGAVNLALVCMVAAQNHHLAEAVQAKAPVERDARPAPPPTVAPDPAAEEKRAAATRDLQRELAGVRKELVELRAAVAAADAKAGKGVTKCGRSSGPRRPRLSRPWRHADRAEKKPDAPPRADAKQLETLTAELRRLNEQFKRVIDFAGVR